MLDVHFEISARSVDFDVGVGIQAVYFLVLDTVTLHFGHQAADRSALHHHVGEGFERELAVEHGCRERVLDAEFALESGLRVSMYQRSIGARQKSYRHRIDIFSAYLMLLQQFQYPPNRAMVGIAARPALHPVAGIDDLPRLAKPIDKP